MSGPALALFARLGTPPGRLPAGVEARLNDRRGIDVDGGQVDVDPVGLADGVEAADEDVLDSYKLHANAYVTKPVDFNRFVEAVRQIDHFFVTVVTLPQ